MRVVRMREFSVSHCQRCGKLKGAFYRYCKDCYEKRNGE